MMGKTKYHRQILAATAVCGWLTLELSCGVAAETSAPRRDLALVGLPPLFEALEAVSNCPDLVIDDDRFARAMASYRLDGEDLSPAGRFRNELEALADADRLRILDDRQAFCSAARLQFLVKNGILKQAAR